MVLIKYPRHRPEGIGLDQVGTCHRVAFVDAFDQIGRGIDEQFVTPLLLTPFVVYPRLFGDVKVLYLRTHRTVDDKDTFV